MNLAAPKQDNRVSEACEMLKHEGCSGSYIALCMPTACRCACHKFREVRPQLVKLLSEIDNYLGAAEPSKAQREQGGDGNPRQDYHSPATLSDVTGSLCDSTGQRQASPSEDRAEGSTINPPETAPAGTRSPAFSFTVRVCRHCMAVSAADFLTSDCPVCDVRLDNLSARYEVARYA